MHMITVLVIWLAAPPISDADQDYYRHEARTAFEAISPKWPAVQPVVIVPQAPLSAPQQSFPSLPELPRLSWEPSQINPSPSQPSSNPQPQTFPQTGNMGQGGLLVIILGLGIVVLLVACSYRLGRNR